MSKGIPGSASTILGKKCNFSYMFDGVSEDMALTTIYCQKGADWSKYSNGSFEMFKNCVNLEGERGSKCDGADNIDATYARADMAPEQPGYFTEKSVM